MKYTSVRDLINKRRVREEFSIAELAREADVDRSDLSKWLSGQKESMNSTSIDRLFRALSLDRVVWK